MSCGLQRTAEGDYSRHQTHLCRGKLPPVIPKSGAEGKFEVMSLLRFLARSFFASAFVADGVRKVTSPAELALQKPRRSQPASPPCSGRSSGYSSHVPDQAESWCASAAPLRSSAEDVRYRNRLLPPGARSAANASIRTRGGLRLRREPTPRETARRP